jgi:uncharacterized tellurite resistance protein B-like protein
MKKYEQLSDLEKYKIKNHIGNLMKLVMIDGKLSKSEADKIMSITQRYGFPKTELVELIREGYDNSYIVPSSTSEKLEQLYDFVTVTVADDTIDLKELDLCRQIAASLKINTSKINGLIMEMIDYVRQDKEYVQVKDQILKLI